MNKIVGYIKEVMKEMQKVSWPKQKEMVAFTIITVIATAIVSLFISGADQVIEIVLGFIYGAA